MQTLLEVNHGFVIDQDFTVGELFIQCLVSIAPSTSEIYARRIIKNGKILLGIVPSFHMI